MCLFAAASSPAAAEVQVKVRADGTKVIVNETPSQRATRTSPELQRVPAGSEISRLIEYHARHQGLSPRLVQAVVQVESGYNPKALSRKGAMGLMQLMPDTAALLGVEDAYNPEQNIRGGTRYLRRQLDRFSGDVTLALAAYNAGPTAVSRYDGVPPYRETRNYISRVLRLYRDGPPPTALVEQARDDAWRRRQAAEEREAKAQQQRGKKVYMQRGENNRIVFTTRPPRSN